jgi:hypothetical protein
MLSYSSSQNWLALKRIKILLNYLPKFEQRAIFLDKLLPIFYLEASQMF